MKVLIATSGTGSRLKKLTQKTNKALIKIAGKPAIEYIFNQYPKDTEFIITLGYLGRQVRQTLKRLYPKLKFTFVWVDKFEGPGASLGYSILCAKDKLQEQFIFHCCDTITLDNIPAPDKNWVAGYKAKDASQYRTHNVKGDKVVWINDKGAKNFDYVHIGIAGIKDYQSFWEHLEKLYHKNPNFEPLNDTFTINEMLREKKEFSLVPFTSWYDTGNLEALKASKKALEKLNEKYRVLIMTSGTEPQLGEITQYTNKALIKIGKKPIISYIIDSYPKDTKFIITLGHFKHQVQDYLRIVYPKRDIKLVEVDKFEGQGSSQLYSMLCAKNELQAPFIYHACDTIINDKIPLPHTNWIAGFKGEDSARYASFDEIDGRAVKIFDKGAIGKEYVYVGLMGVRDYREFWQEAQNIFNNNKNQPNIGDIKVVNELIEKGFNFEVFAIKSWHDTGNLESLKKAREEIKDAFHILDKLEESMFMIKNQVIKFFYNEKMVEERYRRAKILEGLVPIMGKKAKNFYSYNFVDGDLYSEVANPTNFAHFLNWSQRYLWKDTYEVEPKKFRDICYDFYFNKTQDRVRQFYQTRSVKDSENLINDEYVPPMGEIIKKIDFEWLCNTKQSYFHGDFILDNIIKTKRGYCLLDWRQNFGGLYRAGDRYYDFSKLNHNLTVNHNIINNNLFTIDIKKKNIKCDILRKDNLTLCQDILFHFLIDNGYDWRKVKVLTAIIWLNMSPLHHHPFDLFLYYFGKLNLWRAINNE